MAKKATTSQGSKTYEYSLVSKFPLGYRSREDVTNLPPGTLIVGSQNVLTNVSERVQIRQGYSVDGMESDVLGPVLASFDWLTRGNGEVHMRAGGLTSAGNDGKLQYRYVDSSGTVTFRDLTVGLSTVAYNFTQWWNTSESLREVLFVNGTSNIFRWNGATAVVLSNTATTLTKTGTTSWLDDGFYTNADKNIVINGVTYAYTGGEDTTTLTGLTALPDVTGEVVHQAVVTVANSDMTGITATFPNGLIKVMNNQIYLGALTSSVVWLSKVNVYTDFSGSTPRQTGDGGTLILDQNLIGFNLQGDQTSPTMYVGTQDIWYKFNFDDFISVTGASGQTFGATAIKTGRQQGPQSQALISSMKNNTIAVTNEPTIDEIGVLENYFTQIQTRNLSDPIKLDVDGYDFTDGSIFYWRFYILVAVPKEGVVRVFNLNTNNWEAPQTLPISHFYIVDGELYGHSYNTFESYKLFTGYADRVYPGFSGFPIAANWIFSYQNYGVRDAYKSANKFYIEGYINANTTVTATINYELDGCKVSRSFQLDGNDSQFVCLLSAEGSLGKESLGKIKLGGENINSIQNLPPKFRWIPTFSPHDFFECNFEFSVLGTDNRMELLAFGLATRMSTQIPVQNTN